MPPANPPKPTEDKERNEYIPSFIAKKPFYVEDIEESSSDYLEHQRLQKQEADSKWYNRGKKLGPAATKYRKGACENCGAMTHKAKDCMERPRKRGAKYTGKDIQADEVIEDVKLGWAAKRDRWNGYDASEYQGIVDEYNQLEEMKNAAKFGTKTDEAKEGMEDDGAKYEEETDMGRQQSTATRNLRLREDTAKYLLNLDLESAAYDPKTRTMVDGGAVSDQAAELVAEEGFMRASGDAGEFERAQQYAWETQEKGGRNKLHLQANPTSGEIMRKKEMEEAKAKKETHRKALLEQYGDQSAVQDRSLRDAAVVESERYVEYDEHGGIKGAPKIKAKSKYPEDVLINNHTSVWGSWWSDFKWGYACCHSFVKNSYCTGESGKQALQASTRLLTATGDSDGDAEQPAIRDTDTNGREEDVSIAHRASKKRPLDLGDTATEAEMEEYQRKRQQLNDPMAHLLSQDEVV